MNASFLRELTSRELFQESGMQAKAEAFDPVCCGKPRCQQVRVDSIQELQRAFREFGGCAVPASLLPGFDLHRELELLVESGMLPHEALSAATAVPARFLLPENPVGMMAPGCRADLVLLSGNPLEDVANVKNIKGVVVAGQWLDRSALDGMLMGISRHNAGISDVIAALWWNGKAACQGAIKRARDSNPELVLQESPLLAIGLKLLDAGRERDAEYVFRLIETEFPEAYRASYSLGAMFNAAHDINSARDCFRRVIALMPGHSRARMALEGLQ